MLTHARRMGPRNVPQCALVLPGAAGCGACSRFCVATARQTQQQRVTKGHRPLDTPAPAPLAPARSQTGPPQSRMTLLHVPSAALYAPVGFHAPMSQPRLPVLLLKRSCLSPVRSCCLSHVPPPAPHEPTSSYTSLRQTRYRRFSHVFAPVLHDPLVSGGPCTTPPCPCGGPFLPSCFPTPTSVRPLALVHPRACSRTHSLSLYYRCIHGSPILSPPPNTHKHVYPCADS